MSFIRKTAVDDSFFKKFDYKKAEELPSSEQSGQEIQNLLKSLKGKLGEIQTSVMPILKEKGIISMNQDGTVSVNEDLLNKEVNSIQHPSQDSMDSDISNSTPVENSMSENVTDKKMNPMDTDTSVPKVNKLNEGTTQVIPDQQGSPTGPMKDTSRSWGDPNLDKEEQR